MKVINGRDDIIKSELRAIKQSLQLPRLNGCLLLIQYTRLEHFRAGYIYARGNYKKVLLVSKVRFETKSTKLYSKFC